MDTKKSQLEAIHRDLAACRACPNMIGPAIVGPPVVSPIYLLGQAPGSREGALGRPFAWTAGRTLFGWFQEALGVDEATVREKVYIAAVARCFPGKAKSGGDRKPDREEIARCRPFIERELRVLQPELLIPVGTLAISEVLGEPKPLVEVIGRKLRVRFHGQQMDCIALPHPSGASTWHRTEPGKSLLRVALKLIARHPAVKATFG